MHTPFPAILKLHVYKHINAIYKVHYNIHTCIIIIIILNGNDD